MSEPARPSGGKDPDTKRSLDRSWVVWFLIAVAFSWLLYTSLMPAMPRTPSISYTAFVDQVQAGQVASVTVVDQRITGEFAEPMRVVDDQILAPSAPLPEGASTLEAVPGTRFMTTIPPATEATVIDLLAEHGVTIRAEVVDDGLLSSLSPWLLLTLGLPLLLMALVAFRGLAGAQGRMPKDVLGFGRSHARRHDPNQGQVRFAEVAGVDEAKEELTQVVDFLQHPETYVRIGARPPHGILLVGPPGTGKTLLARAVAGEAGVPFFSISASEFVEMFVGVGASRVRDLFVQAKAAAPAIVFVDELDAVGRLRGVGIGGSNDEREQTLNQLLVELDGFEGHEQVVVLAATNRPDVLDPALLRPGRFDRQVMLNLPDRTGREAILRVHAGRMILRPDVDLAALASATPGFAGADLANLINEAALLAARARKRVIEQSDLEAALDRIVLGAARPLLVGERERRIFAYHEAGHALVADVTPSADPLRKVSIVPHGQAMGVTVQAPAEDRFAYTATELRDRLAILLAGRAAEQLVFAEATTGAENDLKEATTLARRMVGRWGMSEDVGAIFLGLDEEHPFLGRQVAQQHQLGTMLLDRAEQAVRELVNAGQAHARTLLEMHREALDRVAEALIREETLDRAQIEALIDAAAPPCDAPAPACPVPEQAAQRRPVFPPEPVLPLQPVLPAAMVGQADGRSP